MADEQMNSLLNAMDRGYAGQVGGWLELLRESVVPNLTEDDRVDIAIPTNIELDADPRPAPQGTKVKPTGKVVVGLAVCLSDRALLAWMHGRRRIEFGSAIIPYRTIKAVNNVTYTYKMNKMPGHEVLADRRWPLLYMDPFKYDEKQLAPWRKLLADRLTGRIQPVWRDDTTVASWK